MDRHSLYAPGYYDMKSWDETHIRFDDFQRALTPLLVSTYIEKPRPHRQGANASLTYPAMQGLPPATNPPTNCKNCGARLKEPICEYCDTRYGLH